MKNACRQHTILLFGGKGRRLLAPQLRVQRLQRYNGVWREKVGANRFFFPLAQTGTPYYVHQPALG
jgi:hypothetical protein